MEFKVSLDDIKKLAGPVIFDRGNNYYLDDHIHSTFKMGSFIKAGCVGSEGYSYFVEVFFGISEHNKAIITETRCSCPYWATCKHVVAVLLTWHHKPSSFRNIEELAQYLSGQKKDWLISFIMELGQKDLSIVERLYEKMDGIARSNHTWYVNIDLDDDDDEE
ncbi:MAG: Zinc finger domain-containing protein [candidate division TM6 bacterium GW2011_GWF2_30_66]|jgi:uncharacterized Zn finger protein|nr:MAG: Zinc finger domain-containing protein [candidate division TM6 bacterium GW2011_GWF2_30_66]